MDIDNHHIRFEERAYDIWYRYVWCAVTNRRNSARAGIWFLYQCISLFLFPINILALLLFIIVGCFRLALANADRVIFVVATSILSFYQVPRKVFYIYIGVLAVTGFLQFLRIDSPLREFLLRIADLITLDRATLFLRKFSGLHYSNPYTRTFTNSKTIFSPVGHIVPLYSTMEVFKFPSLPDLDFSKMEVVVGDCTITIKTLQGPSSALEQGSSTVRSLRVKAPWGDKTVTFNMEDENLGRFVSYLEHVAANECEQVICTYSNYGVVCRALSIVETYEYFNRGLSLVKLEIETTDCYDIV